MNFSSLQDRLRQEIRRRIALGEFSGGELARRAGFAQAHISNFINAKRGLTLAGLLDRVLAAMGMDFHELLDPQELARHAPPAAPNDLDSWDVPMVTPQVAAGKAVIARADVLESFRFPKKLFDAWDEEAPAAGSRKFWTRYVVVQSAESESPSLIPGARASVVLVDRHVLTPRAGTKAPRKLFAIYAQGKVQLRFLQSSGKLLLLRGLSPEMPVEVVSGGDAAAAATQVIGRIVYAGAVMH